MALDPAVQTVLTNFHVNTGQAIASTNTLMGTTHKLGGALKVVSRNYRILDGDLVRHTQHVWSSQKAVDAYNLALSKKVLLGKITVAQANQMQAALHGVHKETVNVTRATAESRKKGGLFGTGDSAKTILSKVASWTIATGAIFGTIGAIKKGIATISEFDSGMVGLQKVFQGTAAELAMLKEDILDTSISMGSLTATTLQASVELGRMGKDRAEISELMKVALLAQNIAEIDAADGVKYLNAAILQFGKAADEAIDILDKWNTLSNRTPVETRAMAEAVSIAGAVFNQAGGDIEDLNAYVATLTATMAKSGAEIGTALKTIASYAYRQKTLAKVFDITGIAIKSQTGDLMDLDIVLSKLSAVWGTLTEAQQEEIAMSVAGVRRKGFFLNLMENFNMTLENQALQWDAAGSSMKENAIRMESLKTKSIQLSAAFEKLAVSTGDAGVLVALKGLSEGLTKLVLNLEQASVAVTFLGGGAIVASVIGLNKYAAGLAATSIAAGKLTVGMRLLNSAMFRWTILLTAAVAAFNLISWWFSKHEREMKQRRNDITKEIELLNKQQAQQKGIIEGYKLYNAVYEEYLRLQGEKEDTTEIEERLDLILNKLNETFPEATQNVEDHAQAVLNMADAYGKASEKLKDLNRDEIKAKIRADELSIQAEREKLAEEIKSLGRYGKSPQKQYDFLLSAAKGQKALEKLREEWVEERNLSSGETYDDIVGYIQQLDIVLDRFKSINASAKSIILGEKYYSQYDELDIRRKTRDEEIAKIRKSGGEDEKRIHTNLISYINKELKQLNELEDTEEKRLLGLRQESIATLKGIEARKEANDKIIEGLEEELELTKQRGKSEKDALVYMLKMREKIAKTAEDDPWNSKAQLKLRKFDVKLDEQRWKVEEEEADKRKKQAKELKKLQDSLNKHLQKKLSIADQITNKEKELYAILNKEERTEEDIYKITELTYDIAKLEANLKAENLKIEEKLTNEKERQLNIQKRLQDRLIKIQRASAMVGMSDKMLIASIQRQANIDMAALGTDGKPLSQTERENIQLKADIEIATIRLGKKRELYDFIDNIAEGLGDALADALTMALDDSFTVSEKNQPWNRFVKSFGRDIGDVLGGVISDSITDSMSIEDKAGRLVATLGGQIAGAIGGAIAGALITTGISWIANKLFPTDEEEPVVEALDRNTQSIDSLTDEMKKFSERYINAPATFALGAVTGETPQAAGGARLLTPGYVYGHAGELIGQPDQFKYHTNNVSNITNDITIYTQPGQNAEEIATLVTKKIIGSYNRGGQYSSKI